MRGGFLVAFHALACVQFSYAVYYDYYHTNIPAHVTKNHISYAGKFKYLTFWDAIVQTLFFLICILNDQLGSNDVNPKKRPFFRKLKDFVHATFSFPLAMFVGITFWGLMFVDRELVLPKAVDPYFPSWLNHMMHTMIMVSTVLEMIVAPRQYPKRSQGLTALSIFMLIYLVWLHVIYYKSGFWVYPVMNVLSAPLRFVFLAVLFVFTIMLYFAGESFNALVWGKETSKRQKPHSKSK